MNEPRPQQIAGMDSSGIVSATKELASTWRVYRKEWVFDSRHESFEAGLLHSDETYQGRIEPEDIQLSPDNGGDGVVVQVRRWNVAGEWKTHDRAIKHADSLKDRFEVQVVARNSRQEHVLKQYGVLKLGTAKNETA